MHLCLRVDLDYVPWDTPDANEFGHGEPAAFLRLLDLARQTGNRFQFFVSNRVLRAFPATAEAVLNEGHDLDWFCKHPEEQRLFEEALELFDVVGHKPIGLCVRTEWPREAKVPEGLRFLSSASGFVPEGLTYFPVETKSDRDAARNGLTAHAWTEGLKSAVRDAASRNRAVTVCVRPQVLAKFDPKLGHVKEIVDLARAVELPIRTMRQALAEPAS